MIERAVRDLGEKRKAGYLHPRFRGQVLAGLELRRRPILSDPASGPVDNHGQ
jgi:hypothetical protein